jgi:uncharacterized protein
MIENNIYQDYVTALKEKDKQKSTFLSFIRSCLKNKAIDLKKDKLDDDEALRVLKKEEKRLQDTLDSLKKSQRDELIENANLELNILRQYLPEQLSSEDLAVIINEAIKETQANSVKDMGKVMKAATAKAGGRANAKEISELVKEKLTSL